MYEIGWGTFVFSKRLKQIAQKYSHLEITDGSDISHDFIVAVLAFAYGKVILDSDSRINYVRGIDNATAAGNGIKKE